jgi:cytochrome c peroxidase
LTAYLRSLPPLSPALTDAPGSADPAVSRGRHIFLEHKCDGCHVSPTYTSPRRFDVDLTDEVGNREFNPPSLLGVSRREPFLHDGRATTLNDLFQRHRHPRGIVMTPREIDDLTAFLKSL